MDAANCAAVLLSVPINYHFYGCTALLVALVVVSGAILNTHLYLTGSRETLAPNLPNSNKGYVTLLVALFCHVRSATGAFCTTES